MSVGSNREKLVDAFNRTYTFDRRRFYAVVVTFYPDQTVVSNIKNLLNYFPSIIIVDNTEGGFHEECLAELRNRNDIDIIRNGVNLGIAEALNQGVERAKVSGANWVATFDQDSRLVCDYAAMIEANLSNKYYGFPIFGCKYVNPCQIESLNLEENCSEGFQAAKELISSGMGFSVETFERIGGFDSKLFIDFVDHDFCARAHKFGIECLITEKPILIHSLGNQTAQKFFYNEISTSNHIPIRRYYRARNTVIYIKTYFFEFYDICLRHFRDLMLEQFLILLFENQKTMKISATFSGIIDGLRGKSGRLEKARWLSNPKKN